MKFSSDNQPNNRGKKPPTGKVRMVTRVKPSTKEYLSKHRVGGKVLDEYVDTKYGRVKVLEYEIIK